MRRGFSKYHAKKTPCRQGHTHASKKEAGMCDVLTEREMRGEIQRLEQQPKFTFTIDGRQLKHKNGHKVGLTADFQYFEGGRNIVVETKGFVVRDWPLRRAIFEALFPHIELREV